MSYDKNLIPANIDELKPGDTVYIAQPFRLGNTPFRYPRLRKETVVRITPKKTKLITDKNDYTIAQTKIYLDNPECHHQRAIVGTINTSLNALNDMSYYRFNIRKLTDEQISQFANLILEASTILNTAKEKE